MPLQILHQNIVDSKCDIIVSPTDESYSGSGGADFAIHEAAGDELAIACRNLPELAVGDAQYTPGFESKAKYIIHTHGPIWEGGDFSESVLLRSCYVNSLLLANRLGAQSVAFPLISSGSFGFPKDRVMKIATDAISDFLMSNDSDMLVVLCVYDRQSFEIIGQQILDSFLSDYTEVQESLKAESVFGESVSEMSYRQIPRARRAAEKKLLKSGGRNSAEKKTAHPAEACFKAAESDPDMFSAMCEAREMPAADFAAEAMASAPVPDLETWLRNQDDSFSATLIKLIGKKEITDVECYKRSNISRKTFSKIINEKNYRPSKQTVLAFAIGLQLTLPETEQLLKTVGFSLSHSNKFDMIIEYYITVGNFNIFDINSALYQYDQPCLGC